MFRSLACLVVLSSTVAVAGDAAAQCYLEGSLYCGYTHSDTTQQKPKDFSDYPCSTWTLGGPEQFFSFADSVPKEVRLRLQLEPPPEASMGLVLLEDTCAPEACTEFQPASCIGGDCKDAELVFMNQPGTQYYFGVEGILSGDDAPYTLTVDCVEYGSCAVEGALECGKDYDEQLVGDNTYTVYTGSAHPKPGLDVVYTFQAPEDSKVTIDLFEFWNHESDLIVLEGSCSPDQVVALAETPSGSEAVTFDAQAGVTYYVVVDNRDAEAEPGISIDLSISCEALCSGDGDCAGATPACDVATGACVPCVSDDHCDAGFVCSPELECVEAPECVATGDCGPGQLCAVDSCVDECAHPQANPCPSGMTCDAVAKTCAAAPPPECEVGADCDPGHYCTAGGDCEADCSHPGAQPCPSNTSCVLGACTPLPPPQCEDASGCGPGEFCHPQTLQCIDDCTAAAANPCGAAATCDAGSGDCVTAAPTCETATTCGPGQVCDAAGDCVADCLAEGANPCAGELVCGSDGLCAEAPAPQMCQSAADCAAGQRCDADTGDCVDDCAAADANPCASDDVCVPATGECAVPSDEPAVPPASGGSGCDVGPSAPSVPLAVVIWGLWVAWSSRRRPSTRRV